MEASRAATRIPAPVIAAFGGLSADAWRRLAIGTGLVIAVLLPFGVKNFLIFQLTLAMIYAIAILGLNLLTGFNGQFSLGHRAFYAIGAYPAAIMMEQMDIGYCWTLAAGGVICLIVGFLFGLPELRLEGVLL